MKKSMRPDNNNLDAITKQARQVPRMQMGAAFSKDMETTMNTPSMKKGGMVNKKKC